MLSCQFKRCRLVPGNVRNRDLTIPQRRLLARVRKHHRAKTQYRWLKSSNSSVAIGSISTRRSELYLASLMAPIPESILNLKHPYPRYLIPTTRKLETRSDVLLVRILFRCSIPHTRQLVSHCRVWCNGMDRNSQFSKVHPGDLILTLARKQPSIRSSIYTEITLESIAKGQGLPLRWCNRTKNEWGSLIQTVRGSHRVIGWLIRLRSTTTPILLAHSSTRTMASEAPIHLLLGSWFAVQGWQLSTVERVSTTIAPLRSTTTTIECSQFSTSNPNTLLGDTTGRLLLLSTGRPTPICTTTTSELNHSTPTAVVC